MFLKLDNLRFGILNMFGQVLQGGLRGETDVQLVRDEEEGRYPSVQVLAGVHLHEPLRREELCLVLSRHPAQARQELYQP